LIEPLPLDSHRFELVPYYVGGPFQAALNGSISILTFKRFQAVPQAVICKIISALLNSRKRTFKRFQAVFQALSMCFPENAISSGISSGFDGVTRRITRKTLHKRVFTRVLGHFIVYIEASATK
jgi:hypothetical protein